MNFDPDLIHFIVTIVLSFLVGLEIKAYRLEFHAAILISTGSNNILKAVYSLKFGSLIKTSHTFIWLMVLGIATISVGLLS